MDGLGGLLAEELLDLRAHQRHAALPADEEHLADVGRLEAAVGEGLVADPQGALDQGRGQLFQISAGDGLVDVAGFVAHHRDEGHVDLRGEPLGERDFGALGSVGDALIGDAVPGEIDAVLLLEADQQLVDHLPVEVDAAEESVAAGRDHFVDAAVQLQDGSVEGAAAQVIDEDALLERSAMGEGDGGGGRLIEDALDLEPRQRAGCAHRLPLVVVVVSGHGDDRAGDLFAQPALGQILHFAQDQRGDLLQRVDLVAQLDGRLAAQAGDDLVAEAAGQIGHHRRLELPAHQPLEAVDGAARVDQQLALGLMADDDLCALVERHDGGDGVVALARRDDEGLAFLHHRGGGIGGAEVDADDPALLLRRSRRRRVVHHLGLRRRCGSRSERGPRQGRRRRPAGGWRRRRDRLPRGDQRSAAGRQVGLEAPGVGRHSRDHFRLALRRRRYGRRRRWSRRRRRRGFFGRGCRRRGRSRRGSKWRRARRGRRGRRWRRRADCWRRWRCWNGGARRWPDGRRRSGRPRRDRRQVLPSLRRRRRRHGRRRCGRRRRRRGWRSRWRHWSWRWRRSRCGRRRCSWRRALRLHRPRRLASHPGDELAAGLVHRHDRERDRRGIRAAHALHHRRRREAVRAGAQRCLQPHQRVERQLLLAAQDEAPIAQLRVARLDRIERRARQLELERDGAPLAPRVAGLSWTLGWTGIPPAHSAILLLLCRQGKRTAAKKVPVTGGIVAPARSPAGRDP